MAPKEKGKNSRDQAKDSLPATSNKTEQVEHEQVQASKPVMKSGREWKIYLGGQQDLFGGATPAAGGTGEAARMGAL